MGMAGGKSNTFLDDLREFMPLVMVRKSMLAAAGGTDAQYIVDRIEKVEMKTIAVPSTYSMQIQLTIWWKLDDGEYHVTERRTVIEDGSYMSHDEVLEKLLDFKQEDALKFAAYF